MIQFLQAQFLQEQWFFLLIAFFVGTLGAGVVARWGKKLFLVDIPVERSSHKKKTTKGGGIGIVLVALGYAIYNPLFSWVFPLVALALFSFYGDRKEISFKWRLFFQFVFIFFSLVFASVFIQTADFFQFSFLWIFFILFISGTANFFNFMDGIDGIASITAIVAFVALGFFAFSKETNQEWQFFCFLIIFAIGGFLPWNFFLPKVFMGDVGSIFLGTTIACSIVFLAQNWFDFFILCSILFPFYADCLLTLIAKKIRKIPLNQPHRIHLYQILANEAKLGHFKVTLFYASFQIIFILLVFSFAKNLKELVWWLFAIFSFIILLYFYLRQKIINRFF